jgi:hypothetical protein
VRRSESAPTVSLAAYLDFEVARAFEKQLRIIYRGMMPLPLIYSRRKRQAEAKGDDVYVYDNIPNKLRVQVVQILREGARNILLQSIRLFKYGQRL